MSSAVAGSASVRINPIRTDDARKILDYQLDKAYWLDDGRIVFMMYGLIG